MGTLGLVRLGVQGGDEDYSFTVSRGYVSFTVPTVLLRSVATWWTRGPNVVSRYLLVILS